MNYDENICNKCPIYNDGLYQLGIRHNIKGAPKYLQNINKKKVLFDAEGFGKNEDLDNKPLIGRAGKLLDTLIEESGIIKFDLMFHNVVKCRPIKLEKGIYKNRTPTDEEVKYCFSNYCHEELLFEPDLIITLGRIPTMAFFPEKNPSLLRGKAQEYLYNNKKYIVLPTYHPAACLYDPKNKPILLRHLTNAANYLNQLEEII